MKIMMKFKMNLLLAALVFVASGCSSHDDDIVTIETPETTTIERGNDARPSWQNPNYDDYELTMTVVVTLQDTLRPYASDEDLMAATIDGQVRALATARTSGNKWYFPLTIAANGGERTMTLSYWCKDLQRIFTIDAWATFDPSAAPTGTSALYEPLFVK